MSTHSTYHRFLPIITALLNKREKLNISNSTQGISQYLPSAYLYSSSNATNFTHSTRHRHYPDLKPKDDVQNPVFRTTRQSGIQNCNVQRGIALHLVRYH